MRGSRACAFAVLTLGVGAGAVALMMPGAEPQARELQGPPSQGQVCRPGAAPTRNYGERPPEPFLRYATRPIVIGCATLRSGRRLELVGYQLGRGKRTSLCIDDYDPAAGVSWGCGTNLAVGAGAIGAGGTTRSAKQPTIVEGAVTTSVARVIVRHELGGQLRKHAAAVVIVRDPAILRAIAVRRGFGRYLAEVPQRARAVSAEARNARRRPLGLTFFEGFRGPAGEGRACYGRPRIADLRLQGRAQAGHNTWVRVIARYPGGSIGSMDVAVNGSASVHADISPVRPPRQDGRITVRLPVRFDRRGTTAVDVTAKGLPLGRRCGKNPAVRRSVSKTLAVRVG